MKVIEGYAKLYYRNNREKIKSRVKVWRENNRLRYLKNQADYYQKNKDKFKIYRGMNYDLLKHKRRAYYIKNKSHENENSRDYHISHKNDINRRCRAYYINNRDDILCRMRKYHMKRRALRNENRRERYSIDIGFKVNYLFANSIRRSLKSGKNSEHWERFVGYTLQDLMEYLESHFIEGMSWSNYGRGGWHIDHIKPMSLFKIKSVRCNEFRKCWSLSNLQPLWEMDNIYKSDTYLKCGGEKGGLVQVNLNQLNFKTDPIAHFR